MTSDPGANKGPDVSKVPRVGPDLGPANLGPAISPDLGPTVSQVPPAGARPSAPPPPPAAAAATPPSLGAAARPSEERFKQSIAGLSRSLGERAALHPDPVAEAAVRRAAVQAQFRAQARRMKIVLGIAGATVASAGVAAFIITLAFSPESPSPVATASTQPAPPVAVAAAAPAPTPAPPSTPEPAPQSTSTQQASAPPPSPPPPAESAPAPAPTALAAVEPAAPTPSPPPQSPPPPVTIAPVPAPAPPATTQAAAADPAPARAVDPAPTPAQTPAPAALRRDEVKEVQTRLLSFGYNPGPIDGNAGRMTQGAVMGYQQERGEPQTGKVDRDVLEQLRQDPAPKVAAAPPPPAQRAPQSWGQPPPQYNSRYASAPPRRNDGLDFVRDADARLSRWFQSLSH